MGHKPNAKTGMNLITQGNNFVLEQITALSDMKMARVVQDREKSLEMIKKRHADELTAAKRNFKHRKKKVVDTLKRFEDMDQIELADQFKDGEVPDDLFRYDLYDYHQKIIYDFSKLERRFMMMMPSHKARKSELLRQMYNSRPMIANCIDIETRHEA